MKARETALLFLSSAVLFGLIAGVPAFGDADAYYHLWMAKRLAAEGPMRVFGWLPFTTLADHFADQHFLYHLALIPFLKLFGDFWGLKIATVLFAAAAMTAFLRLLRNYGVRRPLLWVLPLLFSPGFVFRLLLTKATALALTALFLFLIALKKEKRWMVFTIAFAYVWLHGSWPILIGVAVMHAAVHASFLHGREKMTHWKSFGATVAGLVAGTIFNPFFPENLFFYWEQIVQVAVVGRHAFGVLVGNEWYPVDLGKLVVEDTPVFLPLFGVLALTADAVLHDRRVRAEAVSSERRRDILFFSLLAIVFLLMTLRQARHKEYFLPLALAASALIGDAALAALDARALLADARRKLGRAWKPLLAAAFLGLAVLAGCESVVIQRVYSARYAWTRFAQAGAWMRAHLPADAIVFQTAFDDTPYLLYRDDAQRYIAGLDPRFLSDKDLAKYWEWRDISEGRRRVGLASLIETDFGSRYVFLKRDMEPLRPLIRKDPSFERVYADEECEIWRIR